MTVSDWPIIIFWLFFNVKMSLQPFCFRYKEVKPLLSIGPRFQPTRMWGKLSHNVPWPIVPYYSSYADQYSKNSLPMVMLWKPFVIDVVITPQQSQSSQSRILPSNLSCFSTSCTPLGGWDTNLLDKS